ncbi:hypothetical protein [Cytobacillus purgationiresistens]|uniref:Uncharacterized protein n=1 Tax=Cytobacillus purgationiresistens TaxID=863449 RepID=A0ABU0AIC8_9BACI|nr:hypothetical protein [Cytobacillus purgationiresistens]MDQ0271016.1 hypothetical protein [Cytobacillus purgationiresistens]
MTIQVDSVVLGLNAELLPLQISNDPNLSSLILNDKNKNLPTIISKHKDITYGYIRLIFNQKEIFNEDLRDYLLHKWIITIDWLEDYITNGEAIMIEPEGISIKKGKEKTILFTNAIDKKKLILPEDEFLEKTLNSGKHFFKLFIQLTKMTEYQKYVLKIDKLLRAI